MSGLSSILSVGVSIRAMINVGSLATVPDERADPVEEGGAAVGLGFKRRREP